MRFWKYFREVVFYIVLSLIKTQFYKSVWFEGIIMEPEWIVMRVAYVVLFITLTLMAWAYMVQAEVPGFADPPMAQPLAAKGAQRAGIDSHPPCSFNPLCSCSKPGPAEFGIVTCHGVPFANIPSSLNQSRLFSLSMIGNGLLVLENKHLVGSGLVQLEIRDNLLNRIADDAFFGLAKFLTKLDLKSNSLTSIPTGALRNLGKSVKLKGLNLGYNRIIALSPEDLEGLPTSIVHLDLAGNFITNILEDTFKHLPKLESIDLSDMSISAIHPRAFSSITNPLKSLSLSHNLLRKIPFDALHSLKLKSLELSHNLITSTVDARFIVNENKLSVDNLKLDFNRISRLHSHAFQNFQTVSTVVLAYNPITTLEEDAFNDDVDLEEVNLSHCFIRESLSPSLVFRGLEETLERLDLSFNGIPNFPFEELENFSRIRDLNLDENPVRILPRVGDTFRLPVLQQLSLLGGGRLPLLTAGQLPSLRHLNVSNIGTPSLSPDVFNEMDQFVETVKLSWGKLTSVKANAFEGLSGLKSLDLSENRIGSLDNDSFNDIAHSLTTLKIRNGLRMNVVPSPIIGKLGRLRNLNLGNNAFTEIPGDTFDHCRELMSLNLRFNRISALPDRLFDSDKIPRMMRISLSFNQLEEIREETFSHLKDLEVLELNENVISTIHSGAFQDLTNLRVLNLAGNRGLHQLEDEAFQNLPRLQVLNLSHNNLSFVNLLAFEQLGTLSSLKIDFSYNNIRSLTMKPDLAPLSPDASGESDESIEDEVITTTPADLPFVPSSSVVARIDFSHNNISSLSPHYFVSIGSTLIELDLSYNRLPNLTQSHLFGLKFLQSLNLRDNQLGAIDPGTFTETKHLQRLNLDHNLLKDLPPGVFKGCANLRVLNARHNKLRVLESDLFQDTKLEILKLAENQISRFPENAVARVAGTLVHLDLSGNWLTSLAPQQIECLSKLRVLNLSRNRIFVISENTFDNLHSLMDLDLSGNQGGISSRLFEKRKDSLVHLNLANMSLEVLPDLQFSKLQMLNVSNNRVTRLSPDFGVKFPSLQNLDLGGNAVSDFSAGIWRAFPKLTRLSLRGNPIRGLNNDSFHNFERLHELDVSELPLESVEEAAFSGLRCLKKLTIGPIVPSVIESNQLLESVDSLQEIHLKVGESSESLEIISGGASLPPKVSKITLSGDKLTSVASGAFHKISSRQLQLTLLNTGLADLSSEALHELGEATELFLEIRGNNSALHKIANPNPHYRRKSFVPYLENLKLGDNMSILCSCENGWIEFWLRDWLEANCPLDTVTQEDVSRCDKMLQTLRKIQCQNQPGISAMHAFVSDLECGWESSGSKLLLNGFSQLIMIISSVSLIIVPIFFKV